MEKEKKKTNFFCQGRVIEGIRLSKCSFTETESVT